MHKSQARKDDKAFGKWVVCKQALISSAVRPAFLWPQEDLRCVWEMFAGVLASKISAGSPVGLLLDCIAEGPILSLPAKKHSCKSTYHEGLLKGKWMELYDVVWFLLDSKKTSLLSYKEICMYQWFELCKTYFLLASSVLERHMCYNQITWQCQRWYPHQGNLSCSELHW